MTEIIENLFTKFLTTRMDDRGRIYLPKTVRKQLKAGPGDRLYIELGQSTITVYSVHAVKQMVKRDFAGGLT
mgnify:CR=1 FL=1